MFLGFCLLPSSGLLRGIGWFDIDVSGLPIVSIFKGHALQDSLTLEDGSIRSPEMPISNHPMPRNNPEDGRTQ